MNFLIRQLIKNGGKRAKDLVELDAANPITIDTMDFAVKIGKGIIHIGKEVLF